MWLINDQAPFLVKSICPLYNFEIMKISNKFNYPTAADLLNALATKKISSSELTEAAIARIEKEDKKINAVVVRDFDRARKAALAADAAIARGEAGPLLGIPITVKESFSVKGLATTWGNPEFKNWMPEEDSLVVARLKKAGAIILGKTNVPSMLDDWQTYNDLFGTTHNPWNTKLTSGGSSGGSAAALAMGYVSLELGSDLAGSLRIPAHFCGVCSHNPSFDLVPLRGSGPPMAPPYSGRVDFVVAGPMARTAADLEIGLRAIAGPDEKLEGAGYQLSLPPVKQKSLRDFRVLLLDEHPLYPTAVSIKEAQNNLAEKLKKAGVDIQRTSKDLPDLAKIAKNYSLLLGAWYSALMTQADYEQSQIKFKKIPSDDDSLGTHFFRGMIMNHRDWILATRLREILRLKWRNLYNQFDVVLCPVSPTTAFPHDHSEKQSKRKLEIDGVLHPYSNQYIWVCNSTLFGLPSTVIPMGLTKENLPVGVQIIGDFMQDLTTLGFAKLLEQEIGGFVSPPI